MFQGKYTLIYIRAEIYGIVPKFYLLLFVMH